MNAPFYRFGYFGEEPGLILAFIIGIAFGFCLERAGFGSARKLVSQFYLTDLAVLKVMFTAIVTAMLGLFYLSWLGMLDLSLIYLTPTFLLPQVTGGLLLGFGFIIGGYCPGTSVVAVATGKLDAIVFLVGVSAGILLFGEVYPSIKGFAHSNSMGVVTMPEFFHLPYGLVVFAVVVMAIGAFMAAGWAEKKFAKPEVQA